MSFVHKKPYRISNKIKRKEFFILDNTEGLNFRDCVMEVKRKGALCRSTESTSGIKDIIWTSSNTILYSIETLRTSRSRKEVETAVLNMRDAMYMLISRTYEITKKIKAITPEDLRKLNNAFVDFLCDNYFEDLSEIKCPNCGSKFFKYSDDESFLRKIGKMFLGGQGKHEHP